MTRTLTTPPPSASKADIEAAKAAIAAGCDNPFLERVEVLACVPDEARTILDVGCSRGGFGHALRKKDDSRVLWGVEADAEAAATLEAEQAGADAQAGGDTVAEGSNEGTEG